MPTTNQSSYVATTSWVMATTLQHFCKTKKMAEARRVYVCVCARFSYPYFHNSMEMFSPSFGIYNCDMKLLTAAAVVVMFLHALFRVHYFAVT